MKLGALVIITLFLSSLTFASDCIKTRAAFDIGSGTTKLKVAQVDTCLFKIKKILLEDHRAVGYKQDLKESKDNTLSKKIISSGITSLKALKRLAKNYKPDLYVGVATSAFRTSKNGEQAIKEIAKETGIQIRVISQKTEAIIGFVGASTFSDKNLKDIVVWDIGGGSMQISSYLGHDKYLIYEGKLASVSFKNHIIEEVQNKDPQKEKTPNPISSSNKEQAQRDARLIAQYSVPPVLQAKIKSPNTQIIGIGGVHHYSIGEKINFKGAYTLEMLDKFLNTNIGLTDAQIGGEYAPTDVSNLILVSGFMKALGINKVKTGNINLTDGLLLNPNLRNRKD